jgi:PKD repeat protein
MRFGVAKLHTSLFALFIVPIVQAQQLTPGCVTQEALVHQYPQGMPRTAGAIGPCDFGVCDDATMRDGYIPDSTNPMTTIRLRFHVLANDDGSSPVGPIEVIQSYVDTLNHWYAPSRIQFIYTARYVHSTRYRNLQFTTSNLTELFNMFRTYAESPATQLNAFFTAPTPTIGSIAPRGPNSANPFPTADHSIMVAAQQGFGVNGSKATLAHEIGHALSLWHPHTGVSEVPACSQCYESKATIDRNTVFDFCSDTDPTPLNLTCAPPGGVDACSGIPWGTTQFRNLMGYALPPCLYSFFTPQQNGRMHCWLRNSGIGNWIVGATATASETFGPAPLSVDFAGSSSSTVSDWNWDFGDGGVDSVQNPSHTYLTAGVYDVTITTETSEGTQISPNPNMIWVWGDTLALDTVLVGTNQKFKIDIDGCTHLPLTQMTIPISWAGSLALPLDSIRMTGLRTAGLVLDTLYTNLPMKQLVVRLRATGSNTILTGNGPILSLWFRSPIIKLPGVNQVNVQSFAGYAPLCVSSAGFYTPVISSNGGVSMSCCVGTPGNVDNDPLQGVDIADLTTLVDHLFISFVPLACPDEGNVDGIGGVDIGDLTALVDHLFISFTPLGGC